MKITQLQYLHGLSQELEEHDKIIEALKKDDAEIKIHSEYKAVVLVGPSEFVEDVRRSLIEWVSERRGLVKKKLTEEGLEMD